MSDSDQHSEHPGGGPSGSGVEPAEPRELARPVSRRSLLGAGLAAGVAVPLSRGALFKAVKAANGAEAKLPVQLGETEIPIPPANAETFTTACQFCNVGCGYIVKVWPVKDSIPDGGGNWPKNPLSTGDSGPSGSGWPSPMYFQKTVVKGVESYVWVQPDRACVVNKGDHSTRGATNGRSVYSTTPTKFSDTRDRLLYPMIRSRKGGPLLRATWDEAISLVAAKLAETYKSRGPTALACWRADHHAIEDGWAFGKLMLGPKPVGLYDTSLPPTKAIPQMAIHNRPKYGSETPAFEDIFGSGNAELYAYEDLEKAEVVVYSGVNGYETGSTLYNRMYTAAPKLIVIDPRKTLHAGNAVELGGYHLQLTPNTDIVLVNSMMHHVVAHNLQDQAFIDAHIDRASWQALRSNVLQAKYSPDTAALVTGVAAADIVGAAELIARHRTVMLFEKGLIWQGELNPGAVGTYADLALICGHIGKVGASVGRQGGHQDAIFETGWTNPIPHGDQRPDVWTSIDKGEIDFMWSYLCDPWITTQNLDQFRAALQRVPFHVTQNVWPNGTTNIAADVVLPALAWGERAFVRANLERRIRLFPQFLDPAGEGKPDWEIVGLVGQELGRAHGLVDPKGYEWSSHEAIFDELKNTKQVSKTEGPDGSGPKLGLNLLTVSSLSAMGTDGIQYPIVKDSGGNPVGTPRLYVGGKFAYPDGKARLQAYDVNFSATDPHAFQPPIIRPSAAYPFRLITGRHNVFFQSMFVQLRIPAAIQELPYAELFINPADAAKIGAANADFVEAYNELGTVKLMARSSDIVPAGVVFVPFAYAGNKINALIHSTYRCPRNAAYFKNTHVGVRKLAGAADVVTSFADYGGQVMQ